MSAFGPSRILVVEDDLATRRVLTIVLERAGYTVLPAEDGLDAVELATSIEVDAVLLDLGIPGIDGLEVCRRLRDDPATMPLPVIVLTGHTSSETLVRALDAGADDFLAKPFQAPELLARIRSALRLRRAMAEMEAAHGVVAALANAVEAKDAYTEDHCQRLSGLAHQLGVSLELDNASLKGVVFGALLHDVGKIGVPERILQKAEPLTEVEWAVMRRHPEIGEQICRPLTSSRLFAPIVRHHHERWDGAGYPDRLTGEDIPIGARIVAIVDSFDAMIHDRPYRAALDLEAALEQIRSNAGRQFDPAIVPVFLALVERGAATEPAAVPTVPLVAGAV